MFVIWWISVVCVVCGISVYLFCYCIFAFSVLLKVMRSTAPNAQMSKNQIPFPRGIVISGAGPDTVGGALRLPEGAEDDGV